MTYQMLLMLLMATGSTSQHEPLLLVTPEIKQGRIVMFWDDNWGGVCSGTGQSVPQLRSIFLSGQGSCLRFLGASRDGIVQCKVQLS
jgi:hypothetical protein